MLIFIWRGWGWIVLVAGFTSFLLMQLLVNAVAGQGTYESNSRLFGTLAMLVAAVVVFVVSNWRKSKEKPRTLRDESTGKRVIVNYQSTFFLIPLRYWSYIFLGGAVLIAATG